MDCYLEIADGNRKNPQYDRVKLMRIDPKTKKRRVLTDLKMIDAITMQTNNQIELEAVLRKQGYIDKFYPNPLFRIKYPFKTLDSYGKIVYVGRYTSSILFKEDNYNFEIFPHIIDKIISNDGFYKYAMEPRKLPKKERDMICYNRNALLTNNHFPLDDYSRDLQKDYFRRRKLYLFYKEYKKLEELKNLGYIGEQLSMFDNEKRK